MCKSIISDVPPQPLVAKPHKSRWIVLSKSLGFVVAGAIVSSPFYYLVKVGTPTPERVAQAAYQKSLYTNFVAAAIEADPENEQAFLKNYMIIKHTYVGGERSLDIDYNSQKAWNAHNNSSLSDVIARTLVNRPQLQSLAIKKGLTVAIVKQDGESRLSVDVSPQSVEGMSLR